MIHIDLLLRNFSLKKTKPCKHLTSVRSVLYMYTSIDRVNEQQHKKYISYLFLRIGLMSKY